MHSLRQGWPVHVQHLITNPALTMAVTSQAQNSFLLIQEIQFPNHSQINTCRFYKLVEIAMRGETDLGSASAVIPLPRVRGWIWQTVFVWKLQTFNSPYDPPPSDFREALQGQEGLFRQADIVAPLSHSKPCKCLCLMPMLTRGCMLSPGASSSF